MKNIIIENPLDMHVHLRQDSILQAVIPYTSLYFSGAVVMPNLEPPIMTADSALRYRDNIIKLSSEVLELDCDDIDYSVVKIDMKRKRKEDGGFLYDRDSMIKPSDIEEHFTPFMTLYMHDKLSTHEIKRAYDNGIRILKLYPKGATTNSENGMKNVLSDNLFELLEEASKLGMILSVHGESAGFSMDREREFLEVFHYLARSFPNLKIIIEHISDRYSLDSIARYDNLYGTITLHHMLLTLDDLLGGKLNCFAFCKPIVKTPKDRDAILEAALSGYKKVCFGSDSAPHTIEAKYQGAAGIFSAPIALQGLCNVFSRHDKLSNLQAFVSDNAMDIYNIKLNVRKKIKLVKTPFSFKKSIKSDVGDIGVFMGDEYFAYKIRELKIML